MTPEREHQLKLDAIKVREGILTSTHGAKSGHPGGSLSAADLFTYLYDEVLDADPADPLKENRDRFVLSKGHVTPGYYSALALKGFFPFEDLKTFRHSGSYLQGHPNMNSVPGVDMSTGSLGQGCSVACGMAKGAKMLGKDFAVYTLMGDGEIEEGQIWEAAMFAGHYKLDNLCMIVDINGLQIDGRCSEVMNAQPIDKKFEAFGADVTVIDGHDFHQLEQAFGRFNENRGHGRPTVILMNTLKGKGVSYMEDACGWHGKGPNADEYALGMAELAAAREALETEGVQA